MNQTEEPVIVQTLDETDKKCPQCMGVMDFDPVTGGLSCPFCGYKEEINSVASDKDRTADELDFSKAETTENCDWGLETKTIICESCGAESIYDRNQISSVCPYCGSNQVVEAHDKNTLKPGGIVPFQVSDKDASSAFKKWIKRKWFCPKLAKESAKPKAFQGVYFPYWTFDTQTESYYTAEYGITRHVQRNGKTESRTDWHHTSGHYSLFINDELVIASTTHNQNMMAGLEPFHTEDNKVYQPEYLAGFISQRYSIGLQEGWETAKDSIIDQLKSDISDEVRFRHHADSVRSVHVHPDFSDITYKYLLLPVWLSSYKYKEKIYQFMVNGQTGKVSGKSPISKIKVAIAVIAGIAAAGICYYLYQTYGN